MPKIRALVVDDAVVMRRVVTEALNSDSNIEVTGTAANGKIALMKLPQMNPDVITMDVEMPEMGGLEAVKEIRKTHPQVPIIMVSSITEKGGAVTLEALSNGADDYVTKPTQMANPMDGIDTLKQDLVPKVLELCKRAQAKDETSNDTTLSIEKTISVSKSKTPKTESGFKVLTIGTSTGGPNALADFFEMMPGKLDVPILIVQHMPPMFTKILAERLTKLGPTEFHEGEDHMKVQPGHAYIAPGGKHMVVEKNGSGVVIRTNEEPLENSCRPAVDPLFRSIARVYGNKVLAVVMTGMGQDGARGCEVIAEKGGYIVAQDEASSVVWGMPGYVVGSGLADEILSLRDLPVAVSDKF